MRNPAHVLVASAALVLLLGVSALAQDTDPPYIDITVSTPWADTVTCDPAGTFPQGAVVLNQMTAAGTLVEFTVEPTDDVDPFPDALYTGPAGFEDGGVFPLGATAVTWTVTDGSGNSQVCTFTVTVTDIDNPSTPSPVSWDAGNGEAGTVANGGTISLSELVLGAGRDIDFTVASTDTCDTAVDVTFAPASGSNFAQGDTLVTVTATDDSGNTSQITFTVSIALPPGALEAPVLTEWYDLDRTAEGHGYYDEGTDNEIGWGNIDALADQCRVQCSEDPAFGTLEDEQVLTMPVGGWTEPQTCTFAGLSGGVLYYYRVRAEATAGPTYSEWSNVESAEQDVDAPVISIVQDPIYFEQSAYSGTTPVGTSLTQTTVTDFNGDARTNVDAVSPGDATLHAITPGGGTTTDLAGGRATTTGNVPANGRGNRYYCDTSYLLERFGAWMDPAGTAATDVTFAVYESPTENGTYTLLQSVPTTPINSTGIGWYYSPTMNVPLTAGNYYQIMVFSNRPATWGFTDTVWPQGLTFGDGIAGVEMATTTATPTVSTYSYYQWLDLIETSTTYEPAGTISWTINPTTINSWGTLSYSTTTPGFTDISINVTDGLTTELDVPSGSDLASLGFTQTPLTVTANLSTSDTSVTPALHWWTVEFDAGAPFAGAVSATDDADPDFPVDGENPPMLTNDIPSTGYNLGTHTITWTATDQFGHVSTETQTVVVQDGSPPDIGQIQWSQAWAHTQANPLPMAGPVAIGGTITIQADTTGGASLANLTFTAAGSDNCDNSVAVAFNSTSGGLLDVSLPGSPVLNEIQCTATDSSGNGTSGIIYVQVLDTLSPDTTGVTATIVEIGQPEHETGDIPAPWTWAQVERVFPYWALQGAPGLPLTAPAGVTDICDGDLDDPNPVDHDGYGRIDFTCSLGQPYTDNVINWEFIDDSGNTDTVPQTIRIERLYPPPGGPPH